MKKMDRLIACELEIASAYNLILEYDIKKEKNSFSYGSYLSSLLNNISDEKDILSSFETEELFKMVKQEIVNKLIEEKGVRNNNPFNNNIGNRISNKSTSYIKDNIPAFDSVKKISTYIEAEANDMLLSFVDENIDGNSKYRDDFLCFKYLFIHGLNNYDEKRLIERNFITDKSLYLSSLAYSQIYGISENDYYQLKNILAKNKIEETISLLKSNPDFYLYSPNKDFMLSLLRTSLLLMDENAYKENLSKYSKGNLEDSLLLNRLFNNNFTQIAEKDRERHKVLSIKERDKF